MKPRQLGDLPPGPPSRHLIRNLLRNRSHALLFGATGLGKTRLLWQCACGWARGEPVFELQPREPLRIVWVEADMFREDFEELVKEMKEAGVVPPPGLVWYAREDEEAYTIKEGHPFAESLAAFNRDNATQLVIFDAVPDLHEGDPNDAAVAGKVLRRLSKLCGGAAFVGVMVQRKQDQQVQKDEDDATVEDMLGSQGWARQASAVLQLTRVPSLVWVKHRLVPRPHNIQLVRGADGLFRSKHGDLILIICAEARKGYTSARELARRVIPLVGGDIGDRTIREHIADLEDRGVIARS